MGIMGVIDYEKRDAFEAGEIKGAIDTCKFLKLDKEKTKDAIITQFSLTEDTAKDYLNLYW